MFPNLTISLSTCQQRNQNLTAVMEFISENALTLDMICMNGDVNADTYKLILDHCGIASDLIILSNTIVNFQHRLERPLACKFLSIKYANWVTGENLHKMLDSKKLLLKNTNLTEDDVNIALLDWSEKNRKARIIELSLPNTITLHRTNFGLLIWPLCFVESHKDERIELEQEGGTRAFVSILGKSLHLEVEDSKF